MQEFIERKLKTAKVFKIIISILFVAFLVTVAVISGTTDPEGAVIAVIISMVYVPFILLIIYFIKYHPIVRCSKILKRTGMTDIANDINIDKNAEPTLKKSKIYCGSKAFFSKKPWAIIPYSQIAWTYVTITKAYAVITVSKEVNIFLKDGSHYVLNCNTDEYKWLLENYIIPSAPDIIIGYGAQQKKSYKEIKQANKI